MMDKKGETERFFSIELKSKSHLKTVNLGNGYHDSVLIEGTIGELEQATFAEGVILEIVGRKGTLRINLEKNELREPQTVVQSEKTEVIQCK